MASSSSHCSASTETRPLSTGAFRATFALSNAVTDLRSVRSTRAKSPLAAAANPTMPVPEPRSRQATGLPCGMSECTSPGRVSMAARTTPASQTVEAVARPSAEVCASAACSADATTL
eukprot:scaffold40154_cov33-Tisochrysis_lutea.AAC.3